MTGPKDQVTGILRAVEAGDSAATDRLLPLVYEELRRLAHQQMAREAPGQTLQATALVHEAYLRLVDAKTVGWESRGHFFAAAARAMRQILVDRARRRGAIKRGGDQLRLSLGAVEPEADDWSPEQTVAFDEALNRLEQMDPRKAKIVMLRFFAGLTIEETANALGISQTTVKNEWQFARTWLFKEMGQE
jgi:RNA polymerase sigma factor (TIGR02999 family)